MASPVMQLPRGKEAEKEAARSSLLPEGMTKYDLKKKLQRTASELTYETQRRKEALREVERQKGRIIKSLDAGCLRGGSKNQQVARLVATQRTPSGNFFIGMDSDYLEKPNNINEGVLNEFSHHQRQNAPPVRRER
mmetsp:Transcript_17616/g.38432  ORF Transcript_17616/g.38432 Transcript_17616/m.38432 type:complete len:136 (+) Transcript_17616:150-557(+)